MSKIIIEEDTAREMIAGWADFFDTTLTEETIQGLLSSVMRGKLTFNEETEQFHLKLRAPLQMENGKKLESITIREPEAGELKKSIKSRDEMETAIRVLSTLSDIPLGVIDRLKQRDFISASGVFSFFS